MFAARLLLSGILCLGPTIGYAESLAELSANRILVHDVQERLSDLGYEVGGLDGSYGPKLERAFGAFASDQGLADSDLASQLDALSIDLDQARRLTYVATDNPRGTVVIDAKPANNLDLVLGGYDWKSWDVGRYEVTSDGEEVFNLDLAYCNRFVGGNGFNDCTTDRSRVQVFDGDDRADIEHVFYEFEINLAELPDAKGKAMQLFEFGQGGLRFRHPQTGGTVTATSRFSLTIQDDNFAVVDGAMIDIGLAGGTVMEAAKRPLDRGQWHKVGLEVVWAPDGTGLFRYWLDGEAIWERKGRNSVCEPGPDADCSTSVKYGPYISGVEQYWGGRSADTKIVVKFRNMRKLVNDDAAISEAIADLPTSFALNTERVGGPTQDVRIFTIETLSHAVGDEPFVDTLLQSRISDQPVSSNKVDFNIQGGFDIAEGRFVDLRFVIAFPLPEVPEALLACPGGPHVTTWDDGSAYVVLKYQREGDTYRGVDPTCVANALGDKQIAFAVDFLSNNFSEMASDMVTSGQAQALQHNGLKRFIADVAEGIVTFGLLDAADVEQAQRIETQEIESYSPGRRADVDAWWRATIPDEEGEPVVVGMNIRGQYSFSRERMVIFSVQSVEPIGASVPQGFDACTKRPTTNQFEDGQYRVTLAFVRRDEGWAVADDVDCIASSVPDQAAAAIRLIPERMGDVLADMHKSGRPIANDGLRAFAQQVSEGVENFK